MPIHHMCTHSTPHPIQTLGQIQAKISWPNLTPMHSLLLWIEPTNHLNVPRIILMMTIIKIGLGGIDLGSTNCH